MSSNTCNSKAKIHRPHDLVNVLKRTVGAFSGHTIGLQFQVNGPNKYCKRTHGFVEMRTNHPFIRMVYHPVLYFYVPCCGQIKEQRPHLFKKNGASVHCREQNMNYIRCDKKNCLKWTKRINKSVRDRIVVRFRRSSTSTRRVMEIRERYELFSMLYKYTANNSTPHDNRTSCPVGRQAHILLSPVWTGVHHKACC
jgi:hypothetical protein